MPRRAERPGGRRTGRAGAWAEGRATSRMRRRWLLRALGPIGMELEASLSVAASRPFPWKGLMTETLLAGRECQARLCQNLNDPPLGKTAWNRLLAASE